MAEGDRASQSTTGSEYVAQASDGSNASVTVTQYYLQGLARPQPIEADVLVAARARFEEMPLDHVPAPAGLPAGSHMPLLENRLFVGREPELRVLATALKAGETAAVGEAVAATGMGGIGKSQLASAFAYRYGQFFAGGVFWLSFAQGDAVPAEMARCGGPRTLNLHPGYDGLPLPDQLGLVAAAFASDLPRLLIFDNCEDEDLLATWLPRSGGARVLVTSRRKEWSAGLGVRAVAIGVLPRWESVALLRKFRPDLGMDDPELDAIAEALGDLPLALHMAGSYLKRYRHATTPAAYLADLTKPGLLDHSSLTKALDYNPTKYERHVAGAFELSLEKLNPSDPVDALARALLDRAAFFAPGEPIPRDLLVASAATEKTDRFSAEDALRRIVDLGLFEEEENGAVTLHRLLAAFVAARCEDGDRVRTAVEEALAKEAERRIESGLPAPMVVLQPHLRTVAATAEKADTAWAATLHNLLGLHLLEVADLEGARNHFQRTLAIDEKVYGPNHPNVASAINNLGLVMRRQGDFDGAAVQYRRAFGIIENTFGVYNPGVALQINNLGCVLLEKGDLIDARMLFERALDIDKTTYGPDHRVVASDYNNLASVLRREGKFANARAHFEQALKIDEKALGPDHPDVARDANNLGDVLLAQGHLEIAKLHFERALAIDEKAFGSGHPNVAIDVNNLGRVLHEKGNFAGAGAHYERALTIDESVYGPEHPNVAIRVNNLGELLRDEGDLAGAKAHFERALAIEEKVYGPYHPNVAGVVTNIGVVLRDAGDLAGAKAHFERALMIFQGAYGPDHPLTRKTRANLDDVNARLGK